MIGELEWAFRSRLDSRRQVAVCPLNREAARTPRRRCRCVLAGHERDLEGRFQIRRPVPRGSLGSGRRRPPHRANGSDVVTHERQTVPDAHRGPSCGRGRRDRDCRLAELALAPRCVVLREPAAAAHRCRGDTREVRSGRYRRTKRRRPDKGTQTTIAPRTTPNDAGGRFGATD